MYQIPYTEVIFKKNPWVCSIFLKVSYYSILFTFHAKSFNIYVYQLSK